MKELNINIVGLSFTSPFFKIAQDISRSIRKEISAKIIWGGLHVTAKPHECLNHCDIVCIGEGEYTMLDIAKGYNGCGDLLDIKNIYYKNNQRIIFSGLRPLIRDLDTLPFVDYGGENKSTF